MLQGRVAGLETAVNSLQETVSRHQDQIDAIQGTVSRHQDQIDAIQGTVTRLQDQIDGIQGTVIRLQDQMTTLEGTVSRLVAISSGLQWRQIALQLPNKVARILLPAVYRNPFMARHSSLERLKQDKRVNQTALSAFLEQYPHAAGGIGVLKELQGGPTHTTQVVLPGGEFAAADETFLRTSLAMEFQADPDLLVQASAVLDALVAASTQLQEPLCVDMLTDPDEPKALKGGLA